jgi:uncharacterized iron-regulated membrane protein
MPARPLLLTLHKYLGLSAGVVFALICLSGAALVFEDRLERTFFPHRYDAAPGPALPLQAALDTVRPALAGQPVFNLGLAREADAPLTLYAGTPEHFERVYVHPASGRILERRFAVQDPLGVLHQFHTHLLAGETGHLVIGGIGLAALPLLVSGLLLWWPGRGRLAESLRVRRRPALRFWREIHKLVGVLALPLLALQIVTGAGLIFYPTTVALVTTLTQSEGPFKAPPTPVPAGATPLPLDTLLATARTALPGATATWMHLPAKPDQAWAVRFKQAAEPHPNGRSFVYLDRYTGAVVGRVDALAVSPATATLNALFPLHTGDFGGLPLRWGNLLAGLGGFFLIVSGLQFWRQRRALQRARAAVPPASVSTP